MMIISRQKLFFELVVFFFSNIASIGERSYCLYLSNRTTTTTAAAGLSSFLPAPATVAANVAKGCYQQAELKRKPLRLIVVHFIVVVITIAIVEVLRPPILKATEQNFSIFRRNSQRDGWSDDRKQTPNWRLCGESERVSTTRRLSAAVRCLSLLQMLLQSTTYTRHWWQIGTWNGALGVAAIMPGVLRKRNGIAVHQCLFVCLFFLLLLWGMKQSFVFSQRCRWEITNEWKMSGSRQLQSE